MHIVSQNSLLQASNCHLIVTVLIHQSLMLYPVSCSSSHSDLRSFIGLLKWPLSSTNIIATISPLSSTKNDFLWSVEHQLAFIKAKEHLTEVPTLAYFNLDQPTRLCTDASRHKLGFILLQQGGTEQWSMVHAGSHFLTPAEFRYVVIELELLAIARAVMECNMFLHGLQYFQIITDHTPLVPILNSHHLNEIDNPRLQHLRTRLMAYSFTAIWCKVVLMRHLMIYHAIQSKNQHKMMH